MTHVFKTPFDCDHYDSNDVKAAVVAMKVGRPWHQSVTLLSGG